MTDRAAVLAGVLIRNPLLELLRAVRLQQAQQQRVGILIDIADKFAALINRLADPIDRATPRLSLERIGGDVLSLFPFSGEFRIFAAKLVHARPTEPRSLSRERDVSRLP